MTNTAQTPNTTGRFYAGQTVRGRFVCQYDSAFNCDILRRTTKTVLVKVHGRDVTRCKIHTDNDGREFIFPLGRYSMAPVFRA